MTATPTSTRSRWRRSRSALLACAVAAAALSFESLGAADPQVRIVVPAAPVPPGAVVPVRVVSAAPLESVTARAFDREFRFYPEEGGRVWRGLVGVDLSTEPGRYSLTVEAKGAAPLVRELVVRPGNFPTRRLTVDERFVNPPQEALERIRRESEKLDAICAGTSPARLWKRFAMPVRGEPSSSFGKLSIVNGKPGSRHSGTDFDAAAGEPVHAPAAGRVVLAEDLYYSGNSVILDHGLGLYSALFHLSRIAVRPGDVVEPGATVGAVGATGRVTGPHLHWSVRLAGARVDPLSLVAAVRPPVRARTTR
jgi:murein DD-endopeptidase MepM/ murein hydrolase activator NlpD